MAVAIPRESEFAKERRKWEAHHSEYGPPGRPYQKRDYPMMLHKAGRPNEAGIEIVETKIVDFSERESVSTAMDRERSLGFYPSPTEAIDAMHASDREIATLAAERHHHERRMSPQAQAEALAVDASTGAHVPEIPSVTVKKRQTVGA